MDDSSIEYTTPPSPMALSEFFIFYYAPEHSPAVIRNEFDD
jgi:hypothetical protein